MGEVMELRNLQTFIKVSDTRSFTKAATALGYTQSAVTFQIRAIEKELGVPVFDRIGKSVSLTQAGIRLYGYASEIMRLEEAAINEIKDNPNMEGELRMAIEESLAISFLPDILHYYRSKHPEVDLIVHAAETNEMLKMLRDNKVDLVYTLDENDEVQGAVRPRYLPEPIIFIAPSNHYLAGKDKVTLEEVINEPFILTEDTSSYRKELQQVIGNNGLKLKPFLEVKNTDIICRLVSKGVGISFVPACVTKSYIEEGSVVRVPVEGVDVKMYRQLLYHKDKYQTPQMRAMIDLLLEIDF